MRISRWVLIIVSILWATLTNCDRAAVAPQESFPVVATIAAFTFDSDGIAISVPVTFKICRETDSALESETILESLTFQSDADGYVEYRREFSLNRNERSYIIVDVSSPKYESVQYWTAYFSALDSPGKRVEIGLAVVPK